MHYAIQFCVPKSWNISLYYRSCKRAQRYRQFGKLIWMVQRFIYNCMDIAVLLGFCYSNTVIKPFNNSGESFHCRFNFFHRFESWLIFLLQSSFIPLKEKKEEFASKWSGSETLKINCNIFVGEFGKLQYEKILTNATEKYAAKFT